MTVDFTLGIARKFRWTIFLKWKSTTISTILFSIARIYTFDAVNKMSTDEAPHASFSVVAGVEYPVSPSKQTEQASGLRVHMADRAFNAFQKSNNRTNVDIANKVKLNLDLHHLWTELELHQFPVVDDEKSSDAFPYLDNGEIVLITGRPPDKLYSTDSKDPNDDSKILTEWILPARKESNWSLRKWAVIFKTIEVYTGVIVNRILMALYTEDSTVVYYFVHKGLIKPRKN
ncbi:Sen15 protein-domain-containing protein [Dipodascopsis uninucleata]